MSEQLLSPGREDYPAETKRPSGRSFLSVVKNSIEHSELPTAQEQQIVREDAEVHDFISWRKNHYRRVWAEGREDAIVSVDPENGVL